ncbi:hypothetical protein C9374_001560 [Naegleria lovaniensis]|uniref:Ankyrin repeat protein n=1 Tax=Naegleria lovaniensis TaxID=51637 RepID=A0AA88GVS7_NAELO|nr:uncharacterized protein C9374_001560 [Naegleria lovaniensis]KAG2387228.1 hypothetical protein C9374_001560 [Naegleria lovaniensis]
MQSNNNNNLITTPPSQPPFIRKTHIQDQSDQGKFIQQLIQSGIHQQQGDLSLLLDPITNVLSERDSDGHSLLHAAAFIGSATLVDKLFEKLQFNPEKMKEFCNLTTAQDKKTALMIACERGHLDVVKKLYDYTDKNGKETLFAPIHVAAINGQNKVLEYLVKEKGENVDSQQDVYGYTPLHLAAQYGHAETVAYLIDELNANKNIQCTTERMLPIHTAILNNNLEVLKALVHRHSQDVKTSNAKFYETLSNDHIHINPLLLAIANSHAEDDKNVTHSETLKASAEMVKFLVNELNADYSLSGNNGISALHMAAETGNCELIKFFVTEKHENVNQLTDITKDTPLYLAVINNHLEATKLLLELGADKDIENWRGNTPLSVVKNLASKNDDYQPLYEFLQSQ